MNNPPIPVTPDNLRQALRQWASGVTIVTTSDQGLRHGMTVNSFASVSLEPPLILVSLSHRSRTYQMVQNSGIFGVTILHESQREISERFAGRIGEQEDRFQGLETFTLSTGAPFLQGGLAFFDCQVYTNFAVADHTLFIGEVVALGWEGVQRPLIYYHRAYRRLR